MFEAIVKWHNRNVFFSAEERATFFMLLETQLKKGVPLTIIMKGFYNHPYTDIVEKVAAAGLEALQQGKEVATYWADEGYLSPLEAKLMVESQRQKGVEGLLTAVSFLRESTSEGVSFWSTVVFKNISYIIASLYLLGFTIYIGIYNQEEFDKVFQEVGKSTTDLRLFRLANVFIDYGLFIAIGLILFCFIYLYYRRTLTEIGGRELANKFFLFNLYDRRFQYEVAGMMSAFFKLEINSLPATEALIEIYQGKDFEEQRMIEVRTRLENGETVIEAFGGRVFNDFNYHMLSLNSPDDHPITIAGGFEVLTKIAGELLERDYMRLGRIASIVSIFMALFVMLGLTEFATIM